MWPPVFWTNIIIGINESVRGKTSHWILIYLRITTISTLHQTKLSINFLIRLHNNRNLIFKKSRRPAFAKWKMFTFVNIADFIQDFMQNDIQPLWGDSTWGQIQSVRGDFAQVEVQPMQGDSHQCDYSPPPHLDILSFLMFNLASHGLNLNR